jgi:hypothetical protein
VDGQYGLMAELFVLIHAPVLGPASWAPVAEQLARRGHQVVVPSLAGFTAGGPPYTPRLLKQARAQVQQARAQIQQARHEDAQAERVVLVVHSGAGVFAPYLAAGLAGAGADAGAGAAEVGGGGVAVIFADAALPPEDGRGQVIDAEFLPFVRDLSDDGVVPAWPRWWPAAELDPLFPDLATRERVSGEAASLPLAFFEETLPPWPAGWRSRRCAFLRFSEGYQELARRAAARGWPVQDLPGGHLHMLAAPAAVAEAIASLAST